MTINNCFLKLHLFVTDVNSTFGYSFELKETDFSFVVVTHHTLVTNTILQTLPFSLLKRMLITTDSDSTILLKFHKRNFK